MQSVTSNAVAEQLEVRVVNGGTNGGAYFVDENGNEILISDYSVGFLSWPNSQGYSGFIIMPYYPSDGIGRWAVWNIFQNNWAINVTGLKAIFRK